MDVSILFAKFFAIYFFIVAFAVFSKKDFFYLAMEDIFNTPGLMIITCFLNIIFGLGILVVHPYWEFKWNFMITLMGALSLFFGVMRFFRPDPVKQFLMKVWHGRGYHILGSLLAILAVYFGFFGFVHM